MTNDAAKKSIAALVLSAWKEYQQNGYPKDPNCYIIRASPETVARLKAIQAAQHYVIPGAPKLVGKPEQRFLWFRLEEDAGLGESEVVFGPESIKIEWSD